MLRVSLGLKTTWVLHQRALMATSTSTTSTRRTRSEMTNTTSKRHQKIPDSRVSASFPVQIVPTTCWVSAPMRLSTTAKTRTSGARSHPSMRCLKSSCTETVSPSLQVWVISMRKSRALSRSGGSTTRHRSWRRSTKYKHTACQSNA